MRDAQIVVVDDEVAMVRSLELLLRPIGQIKKAYSVPEVVEILDRGGEIDCIVTDISMPEASGLSLLEELKRRDLPVPVVVMTAYSSVPQAVEAMKRGAFQYIVKPFENREMVEAVQSAIQKKGLSLGASPSLPQGWICNSMAMKDFASKLERLVAEPFILLSGERGVGKSKAARWLHEQSRRSKKDFRVIDARSHGDDLSFKEISPKKMGTLMVAEVFNASSTLQNQLMEWIQDQDFSIVATSSILPELSSLTNFRADLYERLKLAVVRIPSLKERAEDFEALVSYFLKEIGERYRIDLSVDNEALVFLRTRTFAANTRELMTTLQRAALQTKSGVISKSMVEGELTDLSDLLPFSIPVEGGWPRLQAFYQSLEKELIQRSLEKYPDISNTQIAEILGTTRRILELRMKDHEIREI